MSIKLKRLRLKLDHQQQLEKEHNISIEYGQYEGMRDAEEYNILSADYEAALGCIVVFHFLASTEDDFLPAYDVSCMLEYRFKER